MTNPSVGVWISDDGAVGAPDPTNSYRYVGNDPTDEIDPTGEFGIKDAFILPGVVVQSGLDSGWRLVTGEEPGALIKYAHQKMRPATPTFAARCGWNKLSYEFGDKKGKPISGAMFRWSLQDNPSKLTFPTTSPLVVAIKASPEYKDGVDRAIAEAIKDGKTHGFIDVAFTSNDLSSAIGGGTLEYKIVKIKDEGNYELQVRVFDRYNFENHVVWDYPGSAIGAANNASWLSQYLDVINGYDWNTEWWTVKKGAPQ